MRKLSSFLTFAITFAFAAHAAENKNTISFNGIGAISVGITKTEAEKNLGKNIKEGIIYDAPSENKTGTVEGESYILYLFKNQITCLYAQDANYVTDKGIKVGDDFDRAKEVYSNYPQEIKGFDYQEGFFAPMEKGQQLVVTGKNNRQLVFWAHHKKISGIAIVADGRNAFPSCKL